MEARGYSLWLMPEGRTYETLNNLIVNFSRRYNTPYFQPHVTLLGDILDEENKVVTTAETLSSQFGQFRISLHGIGSSETYFQSLFFTAKQDSAIMEANSLARMVFRKSDESFCPHLSILYGSLPTEHKDSLSQEMHCVLPFSFIVDKIHVLSAKGTPRHWKIVQAFALQS